MTHLSLSRSDRRPAALEIEGLSKSFGGTLALANVDLLIRSGEVRGLVGANGSGKSTLVKILAGYHHPDRLGRMAIGGRDLSGRFAPQDVQAAGVRFVHQDLALVDQCSIADNIGFGPMGFAGPGRARISWRGHLAYVRSLLDRVNLTVDPLAQVGELGPAERTLVAIAKALGQSGETHLLVLDEPTARLPHGDVDILIGRLRDVADSGCAILYVTHRMNELFPFADSVTVFKDGAVVATLEASSTSVHDLAERMAGPAPSSRRRADRKPGERRVIAELQEVWTERLHDVSLTVREGEILVLTGAVGSGAEEVGDLLYGLKPALGGRVRLDGADAPNLDIASARAAAVAYLPPERSLAGFPEASTCENILVADFRPASRGIHIQPRLAREQAIEVIRKLAVHPPDPGYKFRGLSGGNQQKALLGKWLRVRPRLLVICEPTHGVDVVSRRDLYREIESARDAGVAIVWITSDVDEAVAVADRIGVFFKGELRCLAEASDVDPVQVNRIALGG